MNNVRRARNDIAASPRAGRSSGGDDRPINPQTFFLDDDNVDRVLNDLVEVADAPPPPQRALLDDIEALSDDARLLAALGLDIVKRYKRLSQALYDELGGDGFENGWDAVAAVGRRLGLEDAVDALLGVGAAADEIGRGGVDHLATAQKLAGWFTTAHGDVADWCAEVLSARCEYRRSVLRTVADLAASTADGRT